MKNPNKKALLFCFVAIILIISLSFSSAYPLWDLITGRVSLTNFFAGSDAPLTGPCTTYGEKQCYGTTGYQVCTIVNYSPGAGYEWSSVYNCKSRQTCKSDEGATCTCDNECSYGVKECQWPQDSLGVYTVGYHSCGIDYSGSGCYYWGSFQACAIGQSCNIGTGECEKCTNECSSVGTRECAMRSGGKYGYSLELDAYRICGIIDTSYCYRWSDYIVCPNGQLCKKNGVCSRYNCDASKTACTKTPCNGKWNVGGEISGKKCCGGEDRGEYYAQRTDVGFVGGVIRWMGDDESDDACCKSVHSCVYEDTCYKPDRAYALGDTDGYDKVIYCNRGHWSDLDTFDHFCNDYYILDDPWAKSGESIKLGDYTYFGESGCCGDDKGEYYTTNNCPGVSGKTACCNSPHDAISSEGRCVSKC